VPLDLLLLSGSAVVNEAILTGESQPLVKECIAHLDDAEEPLDIKG
jgi:manganese-transporting P-type ATPase